MSDLISRQEAIGGICDYAENMGVEYKVFADAAKRMLLNLPSVNCSEKPNNWIPVTERLPDTSKTYIVTADMYGVSDGEEWNKGSIVCTLFYNAHRQVWSSEEEDTWVDEVIAWMPMPEPYEGERKEKE